MKTLLYLPLVLFVFCMAILSPSANAFPFPRKVDSIKVVFDNQQLVLPGETFRIGVTSYKNGKTKSTTGLLGGSVWWLKYKVEVTGGTDFGGKIQVSDRLVPSKGKYIAVKAYPRKQPELQKQMLIALNYDTKIVYRPTSQFDKAPGCQIKGEVEAEFDNGSKRVYDNLRNSKVSGYYQFSPFGGNWYNGKFTIDPDFTNIENHTAALIVNSLRNRSVADTFAVLLDYRHAYQLYFNGSHGHSGFRGANGSSGPMGGNGYDGQDGQNGEPGYDGPDVGVWVDLYHDSILNCNLLYVYGQNLWTGEEYRYLINPDGGTLKIASDGGGGGDGGSGGNGGDGGRGFEGEKWIETHMEKRIEKQPVVKKVKQTVTRKIINAEGKEEEVQEEVEVDQTVYVDVEVEVAVQVEMQGPGGDGGDGGWGGAGGYGGPGGYGGNINLYFTDDAWQYQHVVVASSNGGSGGSHGHGGMGGSGGAGGYGKPNGRNGTSGLSGPSAMGWANSGGSGRITIQPTEEFFFYSPKMEASQSANP